MDIIIETGASYGEIEIVYSDLETICEGVENIDMDHNQKSPSRVIEIDTSKKFSVGAECKAIHLGNNYLDIYNGYDSKISNSRIVSGYIPENFNNKIYISYFQYVDENSLRIHAKIL